MLLTRILVIFSVGILVGCATPVEVKQTLVSKDQAYAENRLLMEQYRELVSNINERHEYWHRYIKNSLLLDLALQWMTTNPRPIPGDDVTPEDLAEISRDLILDRGLLMKQTLIEKREEQGETVPQSEQLSEGDQKRLAASYKILTIINASRLKGLPPRKDAKGDEVFPGGTPANTMERVIEVLPGLVAAIEDKVTADQRASRQAIDMSPFDDYQTNLAALRRVNQMIKNYLDIDVTVKSEDVQALASGVKAVR